MDKINQLKALIKESENIVFFGGAGVSTESNIPDFRSDNGIYNTSYKYSPEKILSRSFFFNNTEEFFTFYRDRIVYEHAQPNKAHYALARLEDQGKLTCVITQNIDGLHQKAGSKNVFELHGSILVNSCTNCGKKFGLSYVLASESNVPKCDACYATIKPDVVLYEEGLDNDVMAGAVTAIMNSDLLIVGGTSLVVYPAAGFIEYHQNSNLVLINKSETSYDSEAKLVINQSIGQVLSQVID